MIKIYFDPESSGFYQTDINRKIPKTAIEISEGIRNNLLAGEREGKEIVVVDGRVILSESPASVDEMAAVERAWRDNELDLADKELYKVQDSDNKQVGNVSQWRAYRKALRAWPEHPKFPDKTCRPLYQP